jgi:zinc/manganese transport system permease protein
MTLLVTPAAAALRLTSSPLLVPLLSMVFAVVAVVGGILLALGGGLPISPYVTTLSFAIYLVARVVEKVRGRQVKS